jgi:hypothetical protein
MECSVDWFILCCRCGIARGDHPGYSAKLTGHIGLLSRKHLSATKWDPGSHLAQSCSVIHPSYFGPLGQRTLVYEPGYQSYLPRASDVATAVVASISKGGLPTVQPSQASAYPYILCERSREVVPSDGSRSIASASPYFPFPLLRWPLCVFAWCQPHYVRVRDRMGGAVHRRICLPRDLTDPSQG